MRLLDLFRGVYEGGGHRPLKTGGVGVSNGPLLEKAVIKTRMAALLLTNHTHMRLNSALLTDSLCKSDSPQKSVPSRYYTNPTNLPSRA